MDKGSGPGRKRGQDTHPGLLPVATQAASEQAGLRAPPPGKAVLTFSPMVNSSIPIMVKRHRWMASSSPTLGKDGAQHSTAQASSMGTGSPPLQRISALGQGPESQAYPADPSICGRTQPQGHATDQDTEDRGHCGGLDRQEVTQVAYQERD